MGKVVSSVEINAPSSRVFSLVCDLEKVVEFMPPGWEVNVRKLFEGPVKAGSQFHVKIKKGLLTINYVEEVMSIDEEKEIYSISIEGFNFKSLKWILDPVEEGTRLIKEVEFKMPYSFIGLLIEKVWAEDAFKRTGEEWLKNIKKHLET
jgi:ribosome-associated toxin RatA of RatAB toxin-antitoxin module